MYAQVNASTLWKVITVNFHADSSILQEITVSLVALIEHVSYGMLAVDNA